MWILVVFMLLFDPLPPPAAGKYNQNKQHCCTQAPSSDVWYRLTVKRPSIYQGERNKCQTSCANFNLKWKRRHPVKNMFGIEKTQFIEMIHWFFSSEDATYPDNSVFCCTGRRLAWNRIQCDFHFVTEFITNKHSVICWCQSLSKIYTLKWYQCGTWLDWGKQYYWKNNLTKTIKSMELTPIVTLMLMVVSAQGGFVLKSTPSSESWMTGSLSTRRENALLVVFSGWTPSKTNSTWISISSGSILPFPLLSDVWKGNKVWLSVCRSTNWYEMLVRPFWAWERF